MVEALKGCRTVSGISDRSLLVLWSACSHVVVREAAVDAFGKQNSTDQLRSTSKDSTGARYAPVPRGMQAHDAMTTRRLGRARQDPIDQEISESPADRAARSPYVPLNADARPACMRVRGGTYVAKVAVRGAASVSFLHTQDVPVCIARPCERRCCWSFGLSLFNILIKL